ncbi:hypothetical protein LOK49_LG15G02167 [Camellia lanceoleosa]|uniref:Uncharacterized protein n=1 Tax=Camellia lanceoleosa TaxID=1840588 RepID=A0ACC0F0P7_9ERIC|nr:hypothetical protein LOK49_LG15G02167 [Camellia lanceoleosa]
MWRPSHPLLRDNLCITITIRIGAVILRISLRLISAPGTKTGTSFARRCL